MVLHVVTVPSRRCSERLVLNLNDFSFVLGVRARRNLIYFFIENGLQEGKNGS